MPKRTSWEVQRAVITALFQRELKARFGGRWLGSFWIFLEPIAHVSYLMFLLGYVRHRIIPGVPFPLFLISGLIPYFMFRSLSVRGMGAVEANRGLFGYRQVKPIDPLVARGALEILLYSCIYIVFLSVIGWYGLQWFPDHPLELAGVSIVLIVFGFSLGLLFAIFTDDLPQLRVLVRIMFLPMYFLSGVIIPASTMPPEVLKWLLWNPLMHLMELQRRYFFSQYYTVDGVSIIYPTSVAAILFVLSLCLYRLRRLRLQAR